MQNTPQASKYIRLNDRLNFNNNINNNIAGTPKLDDKKLIINEMAIHLINNNTFQFNFSKDNENGIINLCKPELYASNYDKYVYKFGYKFNDDVDSNIRTKFINQLKNNSQRTWSEKDNYQFLTKPLIQLNQEIGYSKFDTLIYPHSNKTPLCTEICKYIGRMIPRNKKFYTFELFKNNVQNIKFDYSRYYEDNSDKFSNERAWLNAKFDYNRYYEDNSDKFSNERAWLNAKKAIEDLMQKISNGDYFQIGLQKTKYRPYFYDYLIFNDATMNNFMKIQNKKILLVDDINTTGATIDEMLRYINSLNDTNEIFIFTIIGKEIN